MNRPPRTRELPFFIQIKTQTISSAGDPINLFTDSDKIWMTMLPLNDREVLALGGQLNEYWFKCNTKYNPNLSATNRLRSTQTPTQYYSIESVVDPIGDKMSLDLKIKMSTPNESAAI